MTLGKLRKYYACKDIIMDHLRPNRAVDQDRVNFWRTSALAMIEKQIELSGKSGWCGFEMFLAPTLQPIEREEIRGAILEYGKKQAEKVGVRYWLGTTYAERAELEKLGFTLDSTIPCGTVSAALLVWDKD